MLEDKKKIFIIGAVIGIFMIGGILYYIFHNQEEYVDFEDLDTTLENGVENVVEDATQNNIENNSERKEENKIVVHISGQVVNPGVISLKEGARVIDAIHEAGGLTNEADISKVNLAYILADAQKVYIPNINEKEEASIIEEGSKDQIVTGESSKQVAQEESIMVNINTASAEELQKLPGIGSSIANRIVAYRKENGKFNTIEEIQNVSGIGTSKFNKIKNNICVK